MEIYLYNTSINDGEKLNIVRGRRTAEVKWNGRFYKLHIYSPEYIISLIEDYRNSDSTQPLMVMDNSLIMPSVDKESVIKQLLCLEKSNYFQNRNPQLCYDIDKDFHGRITKHEAILKYRDNYYTLTCALNEKMSAIPKIIIEKDDERDDIKNRLTELIEKGLFDDIPYTKYTYLVSLLSRIY